jgi:hypothetical protein
MPALTAEDALRLSSAGAGLALLLNSAELIAAYGIMADDGLLSWRVSRVQTRWRARRRMSSGFALTMTAPRFRRVLWVRLGIACGLLVSCATGTGLGVSLPIALVAALAVSVRSPYGLDGAFQMTIVILVAFSLGEIGQALGSRHALDLAVGTVALQLALSYAIAGFAKAVSPMWWEGRALRGIMLTQTYGAPGLFGRIATSDALWRLPSRFIIAFELVLGCFPLLPTSAAVAVLAVGVAFHAGNAAVMGLNDFLVSFLAAYPAAIYLILADPANVFRVG